MQPLNNPFEPLQIKWEVKNIANEVFLRLPSFERPYLLRKYVSSIYMYVTQVK